MTERGTLLGGRYELDQIIGRGGMAEVWRARDARLGRDVAIKRLRVDLASDPTFQARFRREAQSAAGLNHPNIVAVYDTGEELDTRSDVSVPYIVMELVEGVTLRDVLRDGRKIVPERALEFTSGVLDALAYSHRSGIIHRDIKPANVMLTPAGTVKVMDFGIARAVADTSATMTQTAAVIGTAQYLSPEQARGEKVDNRSDIYSVGCLLYELLVSQPPFKGDSPVSVVYQHVREIPVTPSELDPEITPGMDAIVLKALAKDRADRYQDAREMRDDITREVNGQPVHALAPADLPTAVIAGGAPPRRATGPDHLSPVAVASPTDVEEVPEEKRSRKGLIILSALAGLVLIGMVIAIAMILNPPKPEVQTTTVPRVTGQTEVAASNVIRDAGLEPKVVHVVGTAENKGTVVDTDPDGGQVIEVGKTVTLTVSDGPVIKKIPDGLVGMTEAAARQALTAAGFTNVTTKPDDPRTEDITAVKGSVTDSDPASGADVPPDTLVTLTVATGQSEVPPLRGLTEQEARTAAQDAGFDSVTVEVQETDEQQAGIVFAQDPPPNTLWDRASEITITIATAPPPPASSTPPPASETPTQTPTVTPTQTPTQSTTPPATESPTSTATATDTATTDATATTSTTP